MVGNSEVVQTGFADIEVQTALVVARSLQPDYGK